MKKILNSPSAYVDETLAGLCAAYPSTYKLSGARVLGRASGPVPGKVGIVTGGGSGHLPVFLGYVGDGLLDACAVGNVGIPCRVNHPFGKNSFTACLAFDNYAADRVAIHDGCDT